MPCQAPSGDYYSISFGRREVIEKRKTHGKQRHKVLVASQIRQIEESLHVRVYHRYFQKCIESRYGVHKIGAADGVGSYTNGVHVLPVRKGGYAYSGKRVCGTR